jgi:hypothetical protein
MNSILPMMMLAMVFAMIIPMFDTQSLLLAYSRKAEQFSPLQIPQE